MFIAAILLNIALLALAVWGALKVAGVQDHVNTPVKAGAISLGVCVVGLFPILGPIFALIALAKILVSYFDLSFARAGLVLLLTLAFQIGARMAIGLVVH